VSGILNDLSRKLKYLYLFTILKTGTEVILDQLWREISTLEHFSNFILTYKKRKQ